MVNVPRKYVKKRLYKGKKKPYTSKYAKNNKIVRRIPPSISSVPFPKVRNCTFIYKQPSVTLTSSAINGKILTRFACNSMFDFDLDNYLGDKQPLYFDQMFGANGPYRYYKVNAWRTVITFTSLSATALHVYFDQGAIGSIVESDTATEAQNRPGVIYRMVTGSSNAKPQTTITSYRTAKSFAPRGVSSGLDYGASYNAAPVNSINSTLLVTNLDSTDLTVFQGVISISHKFYATCYLQDSILS